MRAPPPPSWGRWPAKPAGGGRRARARRYGARDCRTLARRRLTPPAALPGPLTRSDPPARGGWCRAQGKGGAGPPCRRLLPVVRKGGDGERVPSPAAAGEGGAQRRMRARRASGAGRKSRGNSCGRALPPRGGGGRRSRPEGTAARERGGPAPETAEPSPADGSAAGGPPRTAPRSDPPARGGWCRAQGEGGADRGGRREKGLGAARASEGFGRGCHACELCRLRRPPRPRPNSALNASFTGAAFQFEIAISTGVGVSWASICLLGRRMRRG